MRPLSIGMFTYSCKPRGSVVHAACLAEALHDRGHQVTLYALDKDGEGFFRTLRCPLRLLNAAPAPRDMEQLVAQRIAELAEQLDDAVSHDVLHAQDCLSASGLLAARACGVAGAICRTMHHVERFESVYLERCQARSVLESDLCLSVSSFTREEVRSVYRRETARVDNGVDAERFGSLPHHEADAMRTGLGILHAAPLVVSVGGVEPRKNTQVMLDAFCRAHARRPQLRWVIAGGASIYEHQLYRSQFQERLGALSQAQRAAIVQVGVLPEHDMTRLLCAADVLLHASVHEGFGLCVLEALAADTRVVVSRGAPFDEFLDDGCATRVDPLDASDVARGLESALRYDGEQLMRGRARAALYAWRRSAYQHEQAYRTLTAERTRTMEM